MVKHGVLVTPDATQNVLEGITRHNVATIAKNELGISVAERAVDRSELYTAEEIFLTGSAAGIAFVNSVDHRQIGSGQMGPITRALAEIFERVTYGREPKYRSWLTPTYAERRVSAA
jgi:branched-chain amino acid aminotransferase